MRRKPTQKQFDDRLGPDSVRLEATEKAGELKGTKRVVGNKTATAMVASGRWRVCDARYAPGSEALPSSSGTAGGGSTSA